MDKGYLVSLLRLATPTMLNSRKCMALRNMMDKDQRIPETLSLGTGLSKLGAPMKPQNRSDVDNMSELPHKEDVVVVIFVFELQLHWVLILEGFEPTWWIKAIWLWGIKRGCVSIPLLSWLHCAGRNTNDGIRREKWLFLPYADNSLT